MNPNTLELITNELAELNHLRLFKSKIVDKLFGDLTIPNYKPDDEDIFSCVQGLKNLSTGWDEEDEDGDIDLLAYHHPSYNQLKERVSKLSTGLVGGGIIHLKKENDELRLKVDALEKTIVEQKDDIEQYKDTLDEHLHHYDLLKENNEELKADLKVTREVEINGLCGYKTQINELKAEIKQLKEENNKLKEDNSKFNILLYTQLNDEQQKNKQLQELLDKVLDDDDAHGPTKHHRYPSYDNDNDKEIPLSAYNRQRVELYFKKLKWSAMDDEHNVIDLENKTEENEKLKAEHDELKAKHDELKANFQLVWGVLGESSYADELNKILFPENFEED
jgi:chromosome segregation ATPase